MSKSAMIRARIEPDLKEAAEGALQAMGLSPTTAITLFYRAVLNQGGLPFMVVQKTSHPRLLPSLGEIVAHLDD